MSDEGVNRIEAVDTGGHSADPASTCRHSAEDCTCQVLPLPDSPNFPSEDFLASIGLQPRNAETKKSNLQSVQQTSTSMPPGWRRVWVQRKEGKTAGRYDAYVYSPSGRKFRAKAELEEYFKENNLDLNISDFAFSVRDKHLLDITSNVKHGSVIFSRYNHDDDRLPVNGVESQFISSPVAKRLRKSKLCDTANSAVNGKKLADSDSTKMNWRLPNGSLGKRLLVRMRFPTPAKRTKGNDVDSSSSVNRLSARLPNQFKSTTNHIAKNSRSSTADSMHNSSFGKRSVHNMVTASQLKSSSKRHKSSAGDTVASHNRKGVLHHSSPHLLGQSSMNAEKWVPPQSPLNLVEESLYHSSWRLLIATIVLESRQADRGDRKVLHEFFRRWPAVEDAIGATWQQVYECLQPVGVTEETARTLIRFSEEYLSKNWKYPIELYGITKYGDDAYRIFCINEWKQVAPENVKLNQYHRWLWKNHRALGIR